MDVVVVIWCSYPEFCADWLSRNEPDLNSLTHSLTHFTSLHFTHSRTHDNLTHNLTTLFTHNFTHNLTLTLGFSGSLLQFLLQPKDQKIKMLLSFVLLAVVVALTHCQLYGPVDDYRPNLISNNRKTKVIKYFYFFSLLYRTISGSFSSFKPFSLFFIQTGTTRLW